VTHNPGELLVRFDSLARQLPFVVTTRRMMGGYVAYADGKVFASLSGGGLGVKLLGDAHAAAMDRTGARRLRHREDQPESVSYVVFSDDDLADDDLMVEWLTLAARGARSAPRTRSRRR